MDSSFRACKRDIGPLVVAVGLTLLVHAPALDGAFARDDQLLLYDAANQPLGEYLLEMHGGHLMPVHKLIIAAMHGLFGYRAAPFFALMLATHLLNVALLYAALRGVVRAPLALFGAALWGTAIVHQSSLRWFSVYGQLLVASCFLLVFAEWTLHRRRRGWPSKSALVRWNALLIVAGASFGVGIALALSAPVLALRVRR